MPGTQIQVDNFLGGWNANEATTIDDNQLAKAENWYYDENNLIRTRSGTLSFSQPIPDDAIVIHNMDTYNGNGTWAIDGVTANDATNVATEASNQKRGAGAVSFDIDVSIDASDQAIITNSTFTQVDLSGASDTGTIRMWVKFTATVANISSIRLRWGSDASNYYESTVTTQIDSSAFINGWNLLSFNWATATTTGTPTDSAIDYLQFRVAYTASQTDMTGVLVDSIYWASSTSTKPVLGLKSYTFSDSGALPGEEVMVAHVGDVLYYYSETHNNWDALITGLAEIRGQFCIYKDIIYLVNGTDYVSFDGVAAAQEATPVKVKYLIVINDIAYGAGVNGSESTLYYSDGNPASLKIAFANSDPIDEDNGQVIRGLGFIGNFIYVFKDKSIYKFDVTGPTYFQIDKNIGTKAFRSIVNVNNNLLFQGEDGHIYNSFVEEAGSTRTKAGSLSQDLDPYIDTLRNYNVTSAFEVKSYNHVYFAVDEDDSSSPTGILVLNTKLSDLQNNKGVFTRYIGINANDFTIFTNSSGEEIILYANSFGGQVMQMERGLNDEGTQIAVELQTKAFEFKSATGVKFCKNIDGIFHATDGASFMFDAIGDDSMSTIGGATVTVTDQTSQSSTLSVSSIGTGVLGGADAEVLRRFKRRLPVYNTSDKIQIKISDLEESHNMALESLVFEVNQLGKHVFNSDSIL